MFLPLDCLDGSFIRTRQWNVSMGNTLTTIYIYIYIYISEQPFILNYNAVWNALQNKKHRYSNLYLDGSCSFYIKLLRVDSVSTWQASVTVTP